MLKNEGPGAAGAALGAKKNSSSPPTNRPTVAPIQAPSRELVRYDAAEIYGRLLEGAHLADYTFERACTNLEWLLTDDRWRGVGGGFDDVNAFLASVRFDEFRVIAEQRKRIAKQIKALQPDASNRAISKALGVDEKTIRRDSAANAAPSAKKPNENKDGKPAGAANVALSGSDAAKLAARHEETARSRQARNDARKAEFERPVTVSLASGLSHGDFRVLADQIESYSVDLVLTDPPYDDPSLYGEAARIAARILKSGGSFIAYTGQFHERAAADACAPHLRPWFPLTIIHSGGSNLLDKLGVRCGCKRALWYVKDTRVYLGKIIFDPIIGGGREKDLHPWQQSVDEAKYLIENLTLTDGLVVDFMAGSGTNLVAAKQLGRRFIGFEIDPATAERASQRIMDTEAAPGPAPEFDGIPAFLDRRKAAP
jgi:hypothetical protein